MTWVVLFVFGFDAAFIENLCIFYFMIIVMAVLIKYANYRYNGESNDQHFRINGQ